MLTEQPPKVFINPAIEVNHEQACYCVYDRNDIIFYYRRAKRSSRKRPSRGRCSRGSPGWFIFGRGARPTPPLLWTRSRLCGALSHVRATPSLSLLLDARRTLLGWLQGHLAPASHPCLRLRLVCPVGCRIGDGSAVLAVRLPSAKRVRMKF